MYIVKLYNQLGGALKDGEETGWARTTVELQVEVLFDVVEKKWRKWSSEVRCKIEKKLETTRTNMIQPRTDHLKTEVECLKIKVKLLNVN